MKGKGPALKLKIHNESIPNESCKILNSNSDDQNWRAAGRLSNWELYGCMNNININSDTISISKEDVTHHRHFRFSGVHRYIAIPRKNRNSYNKELRLPSQPRRPGSFVTGTIFCCVFLAPWEHSKYSAYFPAFPEFENGLKKQAAVSGKVRIVHLTVECPGPSSSIVCPRTSVE
eukprot:1644924-Rhodomonas_salina.1